MLELYRGLILRDRYGCEEHAAKRDSCVTRQSALAEVLAALVCDC